MAYVIDIFGQKVTLLELKRGSGVVDEQNDFAIVVDVFSVVLQKIKMWSM